MTKKINKTAMIKNIPFISIIIANYNGEKYLSICLNSVFKTKYSSFEVIIIDDGSSDESLRILSEFKKKFKNLLIVKNDKNIGAAASRNKASKIAKGRILVFLDNDTEVDKNWLDEMITVLNSDKTIGACQALLHDFENRKKIQVAKVLLWAATAWGLPIGQMVNDTGKYTNIDPLVGLSAGLAVKKDIFEKIEGFDEDEAVVTEDLDLSWRIWITGNRVVLSPKSIVYHWSKSVEQRKNMKHSEKVIYFHLTKNSLMSIIKNYEMLNAVKYFITSLLISLGRSTLVLLKRHDWSCIIGTSKGIFFIMTHFRLILKKRIAIQKTRKVSDDILFQNIIIRDNLLHVYTKYFSQTNLW